MNNAMLHAKLPPASPRVALILTCVRRFPPFISLTTTVPLLQSPSHSPPYFRMADRDRHITVEGTRGPLLFGGDNNAAGGPMTSQVLTVAVMFPLGGLLLTLAGLTLTGSVIGLVVLTPLFVLFSPILVPAALALALAVAGFLTAGALGLTGLSSLWYTVRQARGIVQQAPGQMDYAKRRMADAAAYAGQKTKETGQAVQSRAEEMKRT
ncbi:oleosin 18 kDa-like [Canna indica]|uniref:Oleosin 18 kDa-like n=1 Tax=Canna indica TaxID=4628 RepID=A0AAQ3PZ46_9LILI|nr:oleosin 18 kDa-like [Canna indica]